MFAAQYLSAKQMQRMSGDSLLATVLSEKGVHYEEAVPSWARFGTITKREAFEIVVGTDTVNRTRVKAQDLPIHVFNVQRFQRGDTAPRH